MLSPSYVFYLGSLGEFCIRFPIAALYVSTLILEYKWTMSQALLLEELLLPT